MRASRRKHWPLVTPLMVVFALAAIFGLPGCSDKASDITSPDDLGFFDLPFDEDALSKGKVSTLEWFTCFGDISVDEGGVIAVPGGQGTFAFVVDAGSFEQDTLFRITVSVLDDGAEVPTIIYEFEPDGLVFSSPAKLILDADWAGGPNSQSIGFYYLDRNKWVYQGSYSRENNQFVIPIQHFSRWGTGDDGRGPS